MSEDRRPFGGFVFFDLSVLLLVVVLTVVCGSAGAARVSHRSSIALGRRIGSVSYAEPRARVTRALGRGLDVILGQQGYRFYPVYKIYVAYPPIYVPGRSVVGLKPRAAAIVMTRSAQYKTDSGLGVGSSLRQLQQHNSQLDCFIAPGMSTPTNCRYGKPPATTVFTINPKTKRVTQVSLVPIGE